MTGRHIDILIQYKRNVSAAQDLGYSKAHISVPAFEGATHP